MDTNGCETLPHVQENGKTGNGHESLVNGKAHAKEYHSARFLSDRAKATEIDGIRGLLIHEKPEVVSFLAGKPNPLTFPFEAITLTLKTPLSQLTSPHASGNGNGNGSTTHETITIDGAQLDSALQYGPTQGLTHFVKWLEGFQGEVHNREMDGRWSVSVGGGSQDLMYKGFMAVMNPGDSVLVETPVYAGVLPPLKALNAHCVEVEVDEFGMSATNLEEILENWSSDKPRPKVVYTNPTGCNPSGCSSSRERKLAVLGVCKKYDILIFEDDPYYYLTQNLIPSYWELETQIFPQGGNVVRFDSFSKLLAAGLRLGFATGPKEILHAIDVTTAGACLHTSAISQAVAYGLVSKWGVQGFLTHAQSVADFYAARRERFEAIAHKHLDGLATWVSPVAGMFLWIDLSPSGIKDSYDLILKEALAKGVLAVPGFAFYPNGRKSSHVRTSFSLVDLEHEAEKGMARLAEAIRERQKAMGMA